MSETARIGVIVNVANNKIRQVDSSLNDVSSQDTVTDESSSLTDVSSEDTLTDESSQEISQRRNSETHNAEKGNNNDVVTDLNETDDAIRTQEVIDDADASNNDELVTDLNETDDAIGAQEVIDDAGASNNDELVSDVHETDDAIGTQEVIEDIVNINEPIYVPLEYEIGMKGKLDAEAKQYYSTILKTERVFVKRYCELDEPIHWSCQIIKIKMNKRMEAQYLLKYDKNEPGKRRESFWKPYWDVAHQSTCGRIKDDSGRILSSRNSKPTQRYFNESSDTLEYKNERLYFNKLHLSRINEESCPKVSLNSICEHVYNNVANGIEETESSEFTIYGQWLDENDVLAIVMMFSRTNPEWKKFIRRRNISAKETLNEKHLLYEREMRNYNILVTFLRQFMFLYDGKQRRCCHYGIKEKDTKVFETNVMGKGLMANEFIMKGEYIVRYEGKILFQKPSEYSEYVVEIKYEVDNTNEKQICYVDAKESSCKGRYCNHSCDPNAVIYKIMIHGCDIPKLWVKAIMDIDAGEEIVVDYGTEMRTILTNMGGCLCRSCTNIN